MQADPPESELQALAGRLAGLEDVAGGEPRPIAVPQQRKQVEVGGSHVCKTERDGERTPPPAGSKTSVSFLPSPAEQRQTEKHHQAVDQ